jgi:hypothetical protein
LHSLLFAQRHPRHGQSRAGWPVGRSSVDPRDAVRLRDTTDGGTGTAVPARSRVL